MKTLIPAFLKAMTFLASFCLLAGCAGYVAFSSPDPNKLPPVEKTFDENKVPLKELQEGGMALGGIVIRDGVSVHRYPDLPAPDKKFDHFDQTEFWSPNCEREFAENISDLSLTPFYRANEFIEDDVFASIWTKYSHGGFVPPELLNSVHDAGSGIRFLVFFRVEYDDISKDIDPTLTTFGSSRSGLGKVSGGGHDPDQVIASKDPTIKRIVGLTMSVYDLESTLCVWEASVFEDVSQSIEPETVDDYAGFQAKQIENGQVAIVQEEEIPGAPAFNWAMDKCLDSLYSELRTKVDPNYRRR